ncbi:unnamed protein product [Clonostachys byssicola]|uniref:Uncharacterized protein n=1 Tax=Clonostachys byssicola TaxID=160290 RepID=A0A9N9Y3B6_9HYPO|nr:unnamed protein product [Clonostachys byssicola]
MDELPSFAEYMLRRRRMTQSSSRNHATIHPDPPTRSQRDSATHARPDPSTPPPPYGIETSLENSSLSEPQEIQILRTVNTVMAQVDASLGSPTGGWGNILALSSAIRHVCVETAIAITKDVSSISQLQGEGDAEILRARHRTVEAVTTTANIALIGKQTEAAMITATAIIDVSNSTVSNMSRRRSADQYTPAENIIALDYMRRVISAVADAATETAGEIVQRRS